MSGGQQAAVARRRNAALPHADKRRVDAMEKALGGVNRLPASQSRGASPAITPQHT